MADYPIIFSAPMIRALLDGRKTMTRRLAEIDTKHREGASVWCSVKPGDRLWVREAWQGFNDPRGAVIAYRATCPGDAFDFGAPDGSVQRLNVKAWRPSIHMPRWASRLTLTVTETKIERLNDISEADARAEGVLWVPGHGEVTPTDLHEGYSNYLNCREGFGELWESLHGAGSWDANPEVVALRFTVERRNIDAKEAALKAQGVA